MNNYTKAILIISNLLFYNSCAAENNNIVAGFPDHFAPYFSLDHNGQPQGFAIDVLNEIADQADLDLTYRTYDSWVETNNALKKGEIDLVPNMGITEKRRAFAQFTSPLDTFTVSIFIRESSTQINAIDDLNGKLVGVMRDNIAVRLLKKHELIRTKLYTTFPDALLDLISGNIDGLAYPDTVVWKTAKQSGLEHLIQTINPPLVEVKRGIAVGKGKNELHQRIEEVVIQFVHTNQYREIYQRWHGIAPKYWTLERFAWAATALFFTVFLSMLVFRYYEISRYPALFTK